MCLAKVSRFFDAATQIGIVHDDTGVLCNCIKILDTKCSTFKSAHIPIRGLSAYGDVGTNFVDSNVNTLKYLDVVLALRKM